MTRAPLSTEIRPHPCFGYCRDCGRTHALPTGNAKVHALEVMREFEQRKRLDHLVPDKTADPTLGFDYLLAGERGHMFGVLECRDGRGETVVLRAFSSLRGGIRDVAGWVPPVLSAETFHGLVLPAQQRIERLSEAIEASAPGSPEASARIAERRVVSQRLGRQMQSLYRFHNFRGESRTLSDALCAPQPVPGGVGECCAPKLLNHAARNGLRPVGIAEFYWGSPNQSGTRVRGGFYPSCETRCQLILGFMLCGLDEGLHKQTEEPGDAH